MKTTKLVATMCMFAILILPAGLKAEPAVSQAPALTAVKFHADWCGSCKAMGPLFEDLKNKFDQKPILFVKLDFTNSTTSHHSKLLSSALGINEVVKANKGTGFMLLLDSNGEVIEKFTKENTPKEISKSIKAQLNA